MSKRIRQISGIPKNEMTSMIDIVFLLLIFFIMTFNIVTPEGDLSMKMPQKPGSVGLAEPKPEAAEETVCLTVRLQAGREGTLESVRAGEKNFGAGADGLEKLGAYARELVEGNGAQIGKRNELKVEIISDRDLSYRFLVGCISKVSGYKLNGEIVPLAQSVSLGNIR